MNYQQEYIEHGYKELTIRATLDGNFALDPRYLHIWPRQTFMMIALPNIDRSFTCTLFMPFEIFDKIRTPSDLVSFYQNEFSDSLPLIGQEQLVHDFFANPIGSLMSIKVKEKAINSNMEAVQSIRRSSICP